ncbi:MAG: RdgB/HAM1 family non-canonical purine NTP pyrophosphatase [Bacillota bacterium]
MSSSVDRVVIASRNPGKLRELGDLLKPLGIETVAQSLLGVGEADEPHATFVENALAKARHACRSTGLASLADDSGLCVAALGGQPGVDSAYFAGREGAREERDARNNAKLLERLRDAADRSAFYYCVLVLMRSAQDPSPVIADARWHGAIVEAPRGTGGFGYDSCFVPDGSTLTAAELSTEEKNRASHRAQALAALRAKLA